MSVVLQIFLILLLILLNGVFALAEIALVSVRRVRLEQLARKDDPAARAALMLVDSPNQFLATVQVGITLIGTLSGALGGATLAVYLSAWLGQFQRIRPYTEEISLVIVVIGITYFSLVFGELIPKRLGLSKTESIALGMARPMHWLSRVFSPVIRLLSVSTDTGLRLLGVDPHEDIQITEEEIKLLLRQATRSGVFQESEQQMVESVFRLGDRFASSIMTPHIDVDWLDLDDPMEVNLAKIKEKKHAFFPAARTSLDHVTGILRTRDLLLCDCELEKVDLEPLLTKPLFIPESMPALQMLEEIKRSEIHFALVIDEYGGILGLVTLFDLLEAIVGDISGSTQPGEALITPRPDGSCLVDGTLSIDEFMDYFEIEQLPKDFFDGYQTLAGFVLSQLGEIPTTGQAFTWSGLSFEVVDMDKRRVDKVLISRLRESDTARTP